MEKSSMLNTTTRGAMKQCIPEGSLFLMNLLDEQSLDKMAESTGTRLWKGFVIFSFTSVIKTKQGDRNEEEQQSETLPMTEEPRPTSSSSSEHHRSAYNIN